MKVFSKVFDFSDKSQVLVQINFSTIIPSVSISSETINGIFTKTIECTSINEARNVVLNYGITEARKFKLLAISNT